VSATGKSVAGQNFEAACKGKDNWQAVTCVEDAWKIKGGQDLSTINCDAIEPSKSCNFHHPPYEFEEKPDSKANPPQQPRILDSLYAAVCVDLLLNRWFGCVFLVQPSCLVNLVWSPQRRERESSINGPTSSSRMPQIIPSQIHTEHR